MKVHELAKELDIQSKDIIAFLNEKGIEVKAAQSSIDDAAVALVKKKFAKKAEEAPKAEKKAEPVAKAEPAPEKKVSPAPAASTESQEVKKKPADAPAGEPVKKKKIIFVNNPHNSKLPGQGGPRPQGGRPDGARPDRRPAPGQGQGKGHVISGSDYTHQIIKPRQDVINRQLQEQRDKEAVAEEAARKASEAAKAAAEASEVKEAPVKPQRPLNVIIEEAPKKEYVRPGRDNRNDRPDGNRGFAPRQNRDGAPSDRGDRKPFQT